MSTIKIPVRPGIYIARKGSRLPALPTRFFSVEAAEAAIKEMGQDGLYVVVIGE